MPRFRKILLGILLALLFIGLPVVFLMRCGNSPWPKEIAETNTLFTAYSENIKTLDPAESYFEHEAVILDSILEMPLEYHYLKRPLELVPMLLEEVPVPVYRDANGNRLSEEADASQVATVEYLCHVKKGVFYQPHSCFPEGTKRELKAEDFKIALLRICDPALASPIYSNFKSFLAGMDEASRAIQAMGEKPDYRKIPLAGFQELDSHTFKLILTRKYPQVLYWMALHFFAPVPYEAMEYFRSEEAIAKGENMGNSPVGTGPYLLKTLEPNSQIVLERNPNYRGTPFPAEGEPGDDLQDAGKLTPFIDRIVFFNERESVPCWIKFLQGYYDLSGVPNSSYDNTISLGVNGALDLTPEMKARGISLFVTPRLVSYYYAFNMLDPVFGGLSREKVLLRQAIAIALDSEEFRDIFLNGCGDPAHSMLPPQLPGAQMSPEYYNQAVFRWIPEENRFRRRSIEEARARMREAGYPNGIGPDGQRLKLHYDHAAAGMPGFKSIFLWMKEKLDLIGIELVDNGTDGNRQREKVDKGNFQFVQRGWVGDYPDAENFLMLFDSANAHAAAKGQGPNYSNYHSEEFDRLFKQLEIMPNSPERIRLIQEANRLLMRDTPCVFDFFPLATTLVQPWLHNVKPGNVGTTHLRFRRIDVEQRKQLRRKWNRLHP